MYSLNTQRTIFNKLSIRNYTRTTLYFYKKNKISKHITAEDY